MQAVIITPTRELAIQISDEARKFCTGTEVKIAILYYCITVKTAILYL